MIRFLALVLFILSFPASAYYPLYSCEGENEKAILSMTAMTTHTFEYMPTDQSLEKSRGVKVKSNERMWETYELIDYRMTNPDGNFVYLKTPKEFYNEQVFEAERIDIVGSDDGSSTTLKKKLTCVAIQI